MPPLHPQTVPEVPTHEAITGSKNQVIVKSVLRKNHSGELWKEKMYKFPLPPLFIQYLFLTRTCGNAAGKVILHSFGVI
jgi:hypothetical protein